MSSRSARLMEINYPLGDLRQQEGRGPEAVYDLIE